MKTVRLQNGAFNEELLRFIPADKVGWYTDDHGHFVDALLPRLIDENQEKVHIDEMRRDIIKLILCPTEELQLRVLKQVFADLDFKLDSGVEAAFSSLFDAVGFGDYLSKKKNPKTGKPYITKATKGAKKNALDALMDQEADVVNIEAMNAPSVEEVASLAPVQPAQVETQKLAAVK